MKHLILLSAVLFLCFTSDNEIGKCYLAYKGTSELKAAEADRLPSTANKTRKLPTDNGEKDLTILDGYRILYNNKKNAPFVNVKVELSDPSRYGADTTNVLANLKHLNRVDSTTMISKDLVVLRYNNYVIYGISRNSIDKGAILGSFVIFAGNNIIVYFDFQNLKPEYRQFKDLMDYQGDRNGFLGNYTYNLNVCTGKGFQK
jgi:hypothetical protein